MANKNPVIPTTKGKTTANGKYKRTVYDPRVDMFKQFYCRPDSYTFGNVRQSALRAGYTEQYANNISSQRPSWWVEFTETGDFKRAEMLKAAENNLHQTIVTPPEDKDDKKLQHDATKFVSERLGKEHYSTRQEVTGKDGKRLFSVEQRATASVPLTNLFKGVDKSA